MAAHAPAPADIVAEAEKLLGESFDDSWTQLDSESTVLRARTGSGRQVIVKHVTDSDFDDPDHQGPPQRFLNEWAGLAFLAEVGARGVAPAVIAASRDGGILVLQDLGPHPNLESVLLGRPGEVARSGMRQFGSALGRLHGATAGHETKFKAIQRGLSTGSPMSDSTKDQRTRRDLFAACIEGAGAALTDHLWASVVEIETLVHEPSPFRVLTHADSGPQNFLLSPDGGRLIDFEFCVYRNGLTDLAGARLGFPQTAASMEVPLSDSEMLESAYRVVMAADVPEAGGEVEFDRALGAACAHWALNRVAAGWLLHVEPRIHTRADLPTSEADRLAKTSLIVDGFSGFAEASGVFGGLASALQNCVSHWRRRWPEIGRVDVYPALRNGG